MAVSCRWSNMRRRCLANSSAPARQALISLRGNAMSNAPEARPSHSLGEEIERLRGKWAAIAAFGVVLVILGAAAIAFSLIATIVTVTLNGVLFLIGGGAEIGMGMHSRDWRGCFLWVIGGLLYVAAGVLCIVNPILTSAGLMLLLGAALIAAGAART